MSVEYRDLPIAYRRTTKIAFWHFYFVMPNDQECMKVSYDANGKETYWFHLDLVEFAEKFQTDAEFKKNAHKFKIGGDYY